MGVYVRTWGVQHAARPARSRRLVLVAIASASSEVFGPLASRPNRLRREPRRGGLQSSEGQARFRQGGVYEYVTEFPRQRT